MFYASTWFAGLLPASSRTLTLDYRLLSYSNWGFSTNVWSSPIAHKTNKQTNKRQVVKQVRHMQLTILGTMMTVLAFHNTRLVVLQAMGKQGGHVGSTSNWVSVCSVCDIMCYSH